MRHCHFLLPGLIQKQERVFREIPQYLCRESVFKLATGGKTILLEVRLM
jgi:hypothetical protein